jgi:hypothetical protein
LGAFFFSPSPPFFPFEPPPTPPPPSSLLPPLLSALLALPAAAQPAAAPSAAAPPAVAQPTGNATANDLVDRLAHTAAHGASPDIKGTAHVVYEEGKLYPHHNLYHITSETWELRALQTVLSSRLALSFITAYSPRMRGGNLRFQAQYLRRIRIPEWANVNLALRRKLSAAAIESDAALADSAVRELYAFDEATWKLLGQAGRPATSPTSKS